ncbi:MAG: CxxxxCH/CxxCH domain-containing protein [Bacteroidota bacterium]|nr:CxxxxCH/CxxCH domain-containing protein [Bacteroidota bacterium]
MNKIFKYLSVISFCGLFIAGCSELKKDIPTTAVNGSIVHGEGFANPSSPNFHGLYFKKTGTSMYACRTCHGLTFTGGNTGVNCSKCHSTIQVHTDSTTTASSHGAYLRAHDWNLGGCKQCHGASYAGGQFQAATSCNNQGCHSSANGGSPEACNTCHGQFHDPTKIAPPRSVTGDTATSNRGVGAHASHLYTASISNTVSCAECHTIPQGVFAAGHLDTGLPAEVNFHGPLGTKNSSPVYNSGNLTCANTYCHGNFSFSKASAPASDQFAYAEDNIVGANFSPKWTQVDGSQAACGTCHGLPPKGHIGYPNNLPVTACGNSGCHSGVVDINGNIIDKNKHINGAINVRGN